MNYILKSLLTCLALTATCTAAGAFEPPLGSRIGNALRPSENPDGNEARKAFRIAECTANLRENAVREFLDALSEADAKSGQAKISRDQTCVLAAVVDDRAEKIRIHTSPATYRGMLAEGFLKGNKVADALSPLPIEHVYMRPWFARTGRPQPLDEMAVCIAAIDPAGIRAIFRTAYDSVEERTVIGALGPSMGQCLETGVALTADALAIRTALAEALYHRAYGPAPEAIVAATAAPEAGQ